LRQRREGWYVSFSVNTYIFDKIEVTIHVLADVNCTFACTYQYPCPNITLTSQADADAWGKCGNVSGNVFIESNNLTAITLTGFEWIQDGGLTVANCSELTEVIAPNLTAVSGSLTFSNLPLLTSITFPFVETFEGLFLESLPLFQNFAIGDDTDTPAYESYTLSVLNTACMKLSFHSELYHF
jgi:hypothetical protein